MICSEFNDSFAIDSFILLLNQLHTITEEIFQKVVRKWFIHFISQLVWFQFNQLCGTSFANDLIENLAIRSRMIQLFVISVGLIDSSKIKYWFRIIFRSRTICSKSNYLSSNDWFILLQNSFNMNLRNLLNFVRDWAKFSYSFANDSFNPNYLQKCGIFRS